MQNKLQLYFKRSHILPYTGLLLILLFDHICVVLRKTFYKIHFPFFIFLTQLTDLRNEISHVLISICTFAVVVIVPLEFFTASPFIGQISKLLFCNYASGVWTSSFPSFLQVFIFSVWLHFQVLVWNIGWTGEVLGAESLVKKYFLMNTKKKDWPIIFQHQLNDPVN